MYKQWSLSGVVVHLSILTRLMSERLGGISETVVYLPSWGGGGGGSLGNFFIQIPFSSRECPLPT